MAEPPAHNGLVAGSSPAGPNELLAAPESGAENASQVPVPCCGGKFPNLPIQVRQWPAPIGTLGNLPPQQCYGRRLSTRGGCGARTGAGVVFGVRSPRNEAGMGVSSWIRVGSDATAGRVSRRGVSSLACGLRQNEARAM